MLLRYDFMKKDAWNKNGIQASLLQGIPPINKLHQ